MPLAGPVAEFVREQYGSEAVLQTRRINIDVNGGRILGYNPNRPQWLIVNTGNQPVTYQWERLDITLSGLTLAAGGSIISTNVRDDFLLPIFDLYGYTMGGSSDQYIIEMIAQQELPK